MEKAIGIGGLFFRAHDPAALGRWYQEHLGVSLTPSSYEDLTIDLSNKAGSGLDHLKRTC